jgi:hypothetical protein
MRGFPKADLFYGRHSLTGESELVRSVRERDNDENPAWLGPIDLEKPYDWGRCTALAWCGADYHVGGITASLSVRREHVADLPLRRLCEETGYRVQANADYVILLLSALYGGRKVYAPERSVSYRLHQNSICGSHAGGNQLSHYIQRYYCLLARQWARSLPQFGPDLFGLLDLEMKTVPAISAGHLQLYEAAKLNRRTHREGALENEIASMKESLSWNITFPLRAVGRLFGKK